jgi:hypothetical protein
MWDCLICFKFGSSSIRRLYRLWNLQYTLFGPFFQKFELNSEGQSDPICLKILSSVPPNPTLSSYLTISGSAHHEKQLFLVLAATEDRSITLHSWKYDSFLALGFAFDLASNAQIPANWKGDSSGNNFL